MQKEILTKEKIKQEFIRDSIKNIITVVAMLIVSIIIIIFLFYIFSSLALPNCINAITIIPLAAIMIFILICVTFESIRDLLMVHKDKFDIKVDKLVGCEEKVNLWGNAFLASLSKPYSLYFASYGLYCIPKGKSYKWSKMYVMSEKAVYYSSHIGDEFYLATINDKILIAYNCNYFILK